MERASAADSNGFQLWSLRAGSGFWARTWRWSLGRMGALVAEAVTVRRTVRWRTVRAIGS